MKVIETTWKKIPLHILTMRYKHMTVEQACYAYKKKTGVTAELVYVFPSGEIAIPFIAKIFYPGSGEIQLGLLGDE